MSEPVEHVTILIQQKKFKFNCPTQYRQVLLDAAAQLNEMIDNLAGDRRFASLEQSVVLAAINMLCEKGRKQVDQQSKLHELGERCANCTKQLELLTEKLAAVVAKPIEKE